MKTIIILFFICGTFSAFGQDVSKKDIKYKPINLEDAVRHLEKIHADSTKKEIMSMTENEFVSGAHFGLGMWMRNNWGLWSGGRLAKHFDSLGVHHPDDMSAIILICYYRHLQNNHEWELARQIKFYQDYWKVTTEHFEKLKTDTSYQREIKERQDSLRKVYMDNKKTIWKPGTVVSGYLEYQCNSFFDLGERTKIKGYIIDWQGDNLVLKVTQYFDFKKKRKVIRCHNIKEDIVIIESTDNFSIDK